MPLRNKKKSTDTNRSYFFRCTGCSQIEKEKPIRKRAEDFSGRGMCGKGIKKTTPPAVRHSSFEFLFSCLCNSPAYNKKAGPKAGLQHSYGINTN
jgi:hypothetical protein